MLDAAGPVDLVFDGVYGAPFEAAPQACARRARLVNVGNLAGASAPVPAGLLRGKQLTISGFAGSHTTLSEKLPALTWLCPGRRRRSSGCAYGRARESRDGVESAGGIPARQIRGASRRR